MNAWSGMLNQYTRGARASLFAFLLLLVVPIVATASEWTVRDMQIVGLQRIAEGTVFNYLPINVGDRVDTKRLQEAIRALYSQNMFIDIEMHRSGDTLVMVVRERPTIESIIIDGNEDIKTEDLENALLGAGIAKGKPFDLSVLVEVSQSLTREYYNRGKYGVQVDAKTLDLGNNTIRVIINIVEGNRARVRQINIVGNHDFDDDELLGECELSTPNPLLFWKRTDRYAEEALIGCLEAVESYYMNRGYADVEVSPPQVAISPDLEDIYITVKLDEGVVYRISEVDLAGKFVVPKEQLEAFILVAPGQTFSRLLLTTSTELMAARLAEDGYSRAEIRPIPNVNPDTKEVAVTFFVDPRQRVYVRRVNFNGSKKVNDEVFRREMRQLEGSWHSNRKVDRSRARIARLPYVEDVQYEEVSVPGSDDQVDIDFTVEDGLPGQFGGGIGYSGTQNIVLNANFVHSNFLGTGNRVSADINTGEFASFYTVSHTDPYVNRHGVSRSISFRYSDIKQLTSASSSFSTQTLSAGLDWGYPISEFSRVNTGIIFQNSDMLAGFGSSIQANAFVRQNGTQLDVNGDGIIDGTTFKVYELAAGLTYDTRNRFIFPNRGTRHRLRLGYALPISDIQYYTAQYDLDKYWQLTNTWTTSLNLSLAYGQPLGDTTVLPPYKHWFAGGPGSVRGFKEGRLGPRDSNGNPYGGNTRIAGSLQLILPTPEKFQGSARFSLFSDVGNVFSTDDTQYCAFLTGPPTMDPCIPIDYDFDIDDLKYSVGIAVDWMAPLGLFRISYAVPLNVDDDIVDATGRVLVFGDETEELQFSVGSAF